MEQNLQPGDFLVFQLEAGFALLRVLGIDQNDGDTTWHVSAYGDFFPDVETAEKAVLGSQHLNSTEPHIALTNRAFESTQVAKIAHVPLTDDELKPLSTWRSDPERSVSDRSVRLMLGLR